MRVLITGIGGASGIGLAKALRKNHYIIGVDANPNAPGKFMSNEFHVVPPASSKNFLPELRDLASECDALFCTVDEELPKVAKNADNFPCRVLVSDVRAIVNSLDKLKCQHILKKARLPVPETIPLNRKTYAELKDALGLPFLIKPRRSRGSRHVYLVEDKHDYSYWKLKKFSRRNYIAQTYLQGEEYTVDVLLDERSRALAAVPRKRILTDSGVSVVGETLRKNSLATIAKRAAEALELKHIVNVQMKNGGDKVPRITEINPRPAGTLILTVHAGINMPELALKLAEDKRVSPSELEYEEGITMYRYLDEVFERKL